MFVYKLGGEGHTSQLHDSYIYANRSVSATLRYSILLYKELRNPYVSLLGSSPGLGWWGAGAGRVPSCLGPRQTSPPLDVVRQGTDIS